MGTLKARYPSGQWTAILGSGFDAANTMRFNSAWGVVAEQRLEVNSSPYTTAPTTTDMTVTFTAVAGRVYEISVSLGAVVLTRGTTANSLTRLLLLRDGTSIARIYDDNQGAASLPENNSLTYTITDRPSAGAHTYAVQVSQIVAGDSVALNASSTVPRLLVVKDIGPTVPVTIAPPTGPYTTSPGNALGLVGRSPFVAANVSVPGTNTMTALTTPVSVFMAAGRRYKFTYAIRAISRNDSPGGNTLGSTVDTFLHCDGVQLGYPGMSDAWFSGPGLYGAGSSTQILDGDDTQHTFDLRCATGGANTPNSGVAVTVYGGNTSGLWIEDAGPNMYPALPLPASNPLWTQPALTSPWTQFASWGTIAYRKIGDIVYLKGMASATGSVAAGAPLFTLPAGFVPPTNLVLPSFGNQTGTDAPFRLNILSTGVVAPQVAAASGWQWFAINGQFSTTQ